MRMTLSRAAACAAATALLPVARIAGFPWEVAALLWAVCLWRVLAGADGRGLVGRRVRLVLEGLTALLGVVLLHELATGAEGPLVLLLAGFAVIQALLLLRPQAPFAVFLLLLLSSIQVAGSAFLRQDVLTLVVFGAWSALLAWSLVLFERRAAAHAGVVSRGAVRRIVSGGEAALPAGAVPRTVAGLCTVGFAVGLLLYVLLPRPEREAEAASGTSAAAGPPEEAWDGEVGARPDAGAWLSGPSESSKGVRLGDIGTVKKDLTPFFEVRMPPGRIPRLRENTYDVYRRGHWTAFDGEGARPVEAFELREGSGGWIPLGRRDDDVRGFLVRISVYRGPQRRLYLERDAVHLRVLRGGAALNTVLRRQDNEQLDSFLELYVDDLIEERVVPPVSDPNALEAARCDAFVSPRPSYVELPEACAPLRALARSVVGSERNPWRRARRLEQWLEGAAFTYTLEMPVVDPQRPVVGFLLEKRRGHCEYFASSMTLLLRALGHPARYVRGFRGGDWLEERGTWMVRGSHYHAWTEMYFEGLGWIAIDATPPDDQAVDARSGVTREANPTREEDAGASFAERFLGYGAEERRRLAAAVKGFVEDWILGPLGAFFGPRLGYAGLVLVAALLLLLSRRRSRVRLAAAAGIVGRKAPAGPYGRALLLLARRGWRRRPPQTAREFEQAIRRVHPEAAGPLGRLTRLYERQRFGGLEPDRNEAAEARAEVASLEGALESRPADRRRT